MIDDGLPKYQRVANALRRRIKDGTYPPGSQLPTEKDIEEMPEFAPISRVTIRSAMKLLRSEGLIDVIHGLGTFVRENRMVTRSVADGLIREYRALASAEGIPDDVGVFRTLTGIEVDVQVNTRYEWMLADDELAEAFGVPPGEGLLRRHYPYLLDGRPHQVYDSYLRRDLVDGTPIASIGNEAPGRGTMRQLADIGVQVDWARVLIRARNATAEQAAALGVQIGAAVFVVQRILYTGSADEPGTPVEVGVAVVPGDRLQILMDLNLKELAA